MKKIKQKFKLKLICMLVVLCTILVTNRGIQAIIRIIGDILRFLVDGKYIEDPKELSAEEARDRLSKDYSGEYTYEERGLAVYTLGEHELPKEFSILKRGGHLVSLRGLPNGEFASRMHMPFWKRVLFKLAGMKYDRMATRNQQHYHFIFVHEDGKGLQQVSRLFAKKHIPASVDEVYGLEDINKALKKITSGGSKGKTILKINS